MAHDSGDPRLLDELGLSSTACESTNTGSGVPVCTLAALPHRERTTLSAPAAAACATGSWEACSCAAGGSGGGFAAGGHKAGS